MDENPNQISEAKAFNRMSHLCARKECCVFDIETELNRLDLDAEVIGRIINQLKKERYIDELRYAKSFIHDKARFNKWGRIKIEYALRQKRISEITTAEAFLYFSEEELTHSLQDLMQTKWRTIKGNSIYEKQNKLIRFALSRGFEMKDILHCMKKIN